IEHACNPRVLPLGRRFPPPLEEQQSSTRASTRRKRSRTPPLTPPDRFPTSRRSVSTRMWRLLTAAVRVDAQHLESRLERRKSTMAFRPLGDRVLVRRVEEEEKTRGGIIIPDTAKEKPQEGEVIAVGPGARDETGKIQPLDVKVGDRILFGKW